MPALWRDDPLASDRGPTGATRTPRLALTTAWWLVVVGAACVVAAWFYTGGARPYGYRGLGEVSVFVFFGLVATLGTTYVQVERITAAARALSRQRVEAARRLERERVQKLAAQ